MNKLTIHNDDTDTNAVAVRSKDIRQAAIRRYLNYQKAVETRKSMVEGLKGK